jgi:DnaJ like chaperone protein
MGWFGKAAFGYIGLLIGGPLGAIAGAALGHHLVDKKGNYATRTFPAYQDTRLRDAERAQAAYFISMFSILGKLAKIDGVVSKNEIFVIEKFMQNVGIPDEQRRFAIQIFNEAKNSAYSIDDYTIQFYQINKRNRVVLLSFLDLLFQVAVADSQLHTAEEAALKRIKDILQISEQEFSNIKARYLKDVDKYYKCLNCSADSSVEEIKKNYKKLARDFHPDTIISKGLPEEFIQFATKRFQEIQEAYEKIKKDRGFP